MTRRKLLVAPAIIASVVIPACSDTTAPKQLAAGGGLEPAIAAQGHYASEDDHARNLFYTTSGGGVEVFAIKVSGKRITTTDIGPTSGGNCASLALSPSGTLYSMCGPLFGNQQLATIDPTTGRATLFGAAVPGLAEQGDRKSTRLNSSH